MRQAQDQMPPEEAQEYLGKLQSGRAELPPEAPSLEHEMLRTFIDTSKRIRELSTRKSDTEKQAEQLRQQVDGYGAAIAEVSGELNGYARMLISAEWSRRKSAMADKAKKADSKGVEAPASALPGNPSKN